MAAMQGARKRAECGWILAVLALACGAARAQEPVLEMTDVELDGPCIRIQFTTDTPGLGSVVGMYYGKDTNPVDEFRTRLFEPTSNTAIERTDKTCDLAPNTQYYILPFATDLQQAEEGTFTCTEVCTNCEFGEGPSPASCDAVGEPMHVTTSSFTGTQLPVDPIHSYDPFVEPEITGSVFPVAVDGNNRCIDFEAQLNAAADANSDLWHRVEIPTGAVCELAELKLPQRDGPGFGNGGILVSTAGDSRLFPPPGVRPDPTFAGVFATLQPSTEDSTAYHWVGQQTSQHWLEAPQGAEGYRFQNVRIAPPDHADMPIRQFDVTDVTVSGSTVFLTLDRTHHFEHNDLVTLSMNPECVGLQGVRRLYQPSGNQIEIRGQLVSGECTSGLVTQAISIPVVSCSATAPVRCDTPVPHGLPDYETLPITSIGGSQNDTLTVATMHKPSPNSRYVRFRSVVKITGSPGGAWDGLHVVTSASPTTIRLQGAFPSPCSSNCGSYQLVEVLQMAETGSEDVDGSRHFQVVDSDTFELLNTSASQPTTGGFFAFHPDLIANFLQIGFGNGERVVLDRTLVDCGGFPYRTLHCIEARSMDRFSIVNSFLRDGNFWTPVDPLSNYWQSLWPDIQFLYFGFGVIFREANDLQVLNNTFWNFRGIVWFADGAPSPPETDISFVRNLMYTTDALTAGHPDSDGRYYAHRHCWEQKAINRTRLEGNWFSGSPVDHHPGGHCLVGSPRSKENDPDRSVLDLAIRNNVVERTGSFMQLAADNGSQKNVPPSRRIEVSNNLARDIDHRATRTSPSGTSGPNEATGFGGYFFSSVNATADITIRRNTWMPPRGQSPHILRFAFFTHSLMDVEKNIFTAPEDDGIGEFSSELVPSCSGLKGPELFDCFVKRDGQRDPLSTFDDNVLIGCLRFQGTAEDELFFQRMASTDPAETVHRSQLINEWDGIELQTPNIYAGRIEDDDSCNDRVEQVLEDGGYEPEPAFAGHGADIEGLLDALGQLRQVTVSRPATNALRFEYRAPDQSTCWIDVSDEASFTVAPSIQRTSDGGGSVSRSVDVPNIGSGEHWYRVQCASHQARGMVQLGS